MGGPFIEVIGPPGPFDIIPIGPMFLSMPGFANLKRNSKLGGPRGPAWELGGLDGKYWIVFGAEAFTVAKVPPAEDEGGIPPPLGPI